MAGSQLSRRPRGRGFVPARLDPSGCLRPVDPIPWHRCRTAGLPLAFPNCGRMKDGGQMPELSASSATAQRDSVDPHVHHKVEIALRDRERELSQLVDMVPSHIWRLRPDGEPTFFNKRMVDYLGRDVTDIDRPGMSRLDALV